MWSDRSSGRKSEAGNAFFYILVAVALLGALAYAITQSGRGNVSQLSAERARLIATEIIEYGDVMANGVAQLRLRGVDEDELCFDDPSWGVSDYDHAGCTDNYNKIYHKSGAGLIWAQAPAEGTDNSASPDTLWHIYGDNEIDEIGTTCGAAPCSDLVLFTDELSQEVCIQINNLLSVSNPGGVPPTDTAMGEAHYMGVFSYSQTIGDEAGGDAIRGKNSGCFQKTGAPAEYVYYKVLIAR